MLKSLIKDTENQGCCSQPECPPDALRRRARSLREESARIEKLADSLSRVDWTPELSQAYYEGSH